MTNKLQGSCLCGSVTFELEHKFKAFYQCHCEQCKKLTGTAFASNLFTDTDNINWTSGTEYISHFEHPDREFSKSFCKQCGSAVPYINKSKSSLVVPAGCIDGEFDEPLRANIFTAEKACWSVDENSIKSFDGFPK